jgi:hypothetical protein
VAIQRASKEESISSHILRCAITAPRDSITINRPSQSVIPGYFRAELARARPAGPAVGSPRRERGRPGRPVPTTRRRRAPRRSRSAHGSIDPAASAPERDPVVSPGTDFPATPWWSAPVTRGRRAQAPVPYSVESGARPPRILLSGPTRTAPRCLDTGEAALGLPAGSSELTPEMTKSEAPASDRGGRSHSGDGPDRAAQSAGWVEDIR